jgi:hypothetical protein
MKKIIFKTKCLSGYCSGEACFTGDVIVHGSNEDLFVYKHKCSFCGEVSFYDKVYPREEMDTTDLEIRWE